MAYSRTKKYSSNVHVVMLDNPNSYHQKWTIALSTNRVQPRWTRVDAIAVRVLDEPRQTVDQAGQTRPQHHADNDADMYPYVAAHT